MSANAFGPDGPSLEAQAKRFRDLLQGKRRIIPLLLDDAPIPPSLEQYKYLDWRTPNDAAFDTLLKACPPPGQITHLGLAIIYSRQAV